LPGITYEPGCRCKLCGAWLHLIMRYHEYQPASVLSSSVECLWLLEGEAAAVSVAPERLLPDGCVELILNSGARFREYAADGAGVLQPRR
jgi:hypothetical protein